MIVLGIDAAWTATQPSGVALVRDRECVRVAPSYESFLADKLDWAEMPKGGAPEMGRIVEHAERLARGKIDVIAMDMPLSRLPITKRRECDNEVSRRFGKQKCGVHSPSAERPGKIADSIREQLEERGFEVVTRGRETPALLEVYPHIALLHLLGADERIPYKASKTTTYWPHDTIEKRREKLRRQWKRIRAALDRRIRNIEIPPPPRGASFGQLKRYEDALDAVICAYVGIEYLAGRATPYGASETGAIWGPTAR